VWKIHAAQKVLEAWIGAKVIDPKVGPQEVRKVGRSFSVRFLQEFEGFVLGSPFSVDHCKFVIASMCSVRLIRMRRELRTLKIIAERGTAFYAVR